MTNSLQNLPSIYQNDYQSWLDETIRLLKKRQLDRLDYDHLIEELEVLGNEQKSAVESLVIQLIQHLLFYQFWQSERDYNDRHWRVELIAFRTQLEFRLTTNLKNHIYSRLDYLYSKARKMAEIKTDLPLPSQNPYSLEEILDEDRFPKD
jgi:hypothetical protein